MKKIHKKIGILFLSLIMITAGISSILYVFSDNIIFFYNPTDLKNQSIVSGKNIRIGGLIKDNSFKKENNKYLFTLTDIETDINVIYEGILPNMFRNGQGIVAEGYLQENNSFYAKNILVKHDENYMPREIANSLKDKGYWKGKDNQ